MKELKLLWTAYPFDAGFCITDDTDAATIKQTKIVYDFLLLNKFVTTKTVWRYKPKDFCGIPPTPESTLRGVTLEDIEYLEYCKMLSKNGFEICLHGASSGNNLRESTISAIDFINSEINISDTYICHSKNADNLYWENKVTKLFPFNQILKFYSKYESYGEINDSPYFWGDICKNKINQIRLYRTRNINTLRVNPSMPYFDPNKPFVNYWFSATKRRLADCATDRAIEKIKQENGLTVLYQYLHRYADIDSGSLNKDFAQSIEKLSNDDRLQISTCSYFMNRLRMVRNIVVINFDDYYWIINANDTSIENLQFQFSNSDIVEIQSENIIRNNDRIAIPIINSHDSFKIKSKIPLKFTKCKFIKISPNINHTIKTPLKEFSFNLIKKTVSISDEFKYDLVLKFENNMNGKLDERISMLEEYKLLYHQFYIIIREILFKGRKIDSNKYLDSSKEILLENHDNW